MSENSKNLEELKAESPKKVNVVILHTNTALADSLAALLRKRGQTVDVYYTGEKFLENFEKYLKDTKFCFNYSLGGNLTGKDIAIRLHDAGYTKIYLYSGWQRSTIDEFDLPDYLQVILYYESDNVTRDLINLLGA
jgi:hypothetical protein